MRHLFMVNTGADEVFSMMVVQNTVAMGRVFV